MTCIPVPTDLAFRLLDEVSRKRALANDESLLLEQVISMGRKPKGAHIRWTPQLDRALWQASYRKGALKAFAEKYGITPQAASNRLLRLREKKAARKAKVTGDKVKG
jgi:hypothetical protein